MMKRLSCLLLALLLALISHAGAQTGDGALEWSVIEAAGPAGSYISYPLFNGGEAAEKINDTIRAGAFLDEYVQMLATLSDGGTGLRIDSLVYPETISGPWVSVILSAKGRMLRGRPSQIWYAFIFDTATGETVPPESLFNDPETAVRMMESIVSEEEEHLSDYLENRELFPLPLDNAALTPAGITLCYPYDQLSTLSGYAGQITVPYDRISELMDYVPESVRIDEYTPDKIMDAAGRGMLYGLPAIVGSGAASVLDKYRCSIDSGYYPGGLSFEVEDPALAYVHIITDEAAETVTGLVAHRANCAGIITGSSLRSDVIQAMGEPDQSMAVSSPEAAELLLTEGTLDRYACGGYVLGFDYDPEGILYAVTLFAGEIR